MNEADRIALRKRARRDPSVDDAIGRIRTTRRDFERSLVTDRLALISLFHEVKALGVELASLHEALANEKVTTDSPETAEERTRNDAVNQSHVTALESRRKNAATGLIVAIDRLIDELWLRLGLPEWSVRGGPIACADVTVVELFHLCGNYLRHEHQWRLADAAVTSKAKKNIERLRCAGFDYRDSKMLARVVDALPYTNFTSLEVDLLDFMEFISWFTQEKVISVWATGVGETFAIRFNAYDSETSGYGKLAIALNREVGAKWKLPSR